MKNENPARRITELRIRRELILLFFVAILLGLTGCPEPEPTWQDRYIIEHCLRCQECCILVTPEDEGESDD